MSFVTQRLRRYRAAKKEVDKWSVTGLADAVGVSVPTMYAYESDPNKMPKEVADKVMKYLDLKSLEEVYN